MGFSPKLGAVSNSSILVYDLSIFFTFWVVAKVQQLVKCCLAFIICFYCPNLVRALVMFGWNNCFLYLISCNLVLKCLTLSTSFMLAVVILLMILCGSYFKTLKIQMRISFWLSRSSLTQRRAPVSIESFRGLHSSV